MKIYLESLIIILIGTTVRISESLFCQTGEVFSLCGNNECRPTCKLPQGPKACDPKCSAGCICIPRLVRRETDRKCVTLEECNENSSTESPHSGFLHPTGERKKKQSLFCPPGETFSFCGNNECRPTCKFPQGPQFCDPKCWPGCICIPRLVRRETDRTCVTLEECSEYSSTESPYSTGKPPDKTPTRQPPYETSTQREFKHPTGEPQYKRQLPDKHPPRQSPNKRPYPPRQSPNKRPYPPGQLPDERPYSPKQPPCRRRKGFSRPVLGPNPLKKENIAFRWPPTKKSKVKMYLRKFSRTRKQPGRRRKGKCSPRRYRRFSGTPPCG